LIITSSLGPDHTIADLLAPEQIRVPLASRVKSDVLYELSGILAARAGIPDQTAEIYRAVERREAVLSTGIGNGVAIPHAKSPVLQAMTMAVGTTSDPIDFDSLDGGPVRLVWMLAGPERTTGLHVRTLARISGLLRVEMVRTGLIAAASPEEFLTRVAEAERD
jgi:mannitol/fructose-specific phosphotransferase system IIA component (Ntr-type)